ncbi:hypothetical protein VTO73DRAFT_4851 [Trametes versicolor]
MASATIFTIPVYVVLASPERDGTPRNMIMLVTLFLHGGSHLQAQVDWQTVRSEMSFLTQSVSGVLASTPLFVDVLYPPEILHNPLYLVVNDPPGYTFPNRLLITINITEFNPGDPSSLRVHSQLSVLAPARRVDAGAIRLRASVVPPPVYAPSTSDEPETPTASATETT